MFKATPERQNQHLLSEQLITQARLDSVQSSDRIAIRLPGQPLSIPADVLQGLTQRCTNVAIAKLQACSRQIYHFVGQDSDCQRKLNEAFVEARLSQIDSGVDQLKANIQQVARNMPPELLTAAIISDRDSVESMQASLQNRSYHTNRQRITRAAAWIAFFSSLTFIAVEVATHPNDDISPFLLVPAVFVAAASPLGCLSADMRNIPIAESFDRFLESLNRKKRNVEERLTLLADTDVEANHSPAMTHEN